MPQTLSAHNNTCAAFDCLTRIPTSDTFCSFHWTLAPAEITAQVTSQDGITAPIRQRTITAIAHREFRLMTTTLPDVRAIANAPRDRLRPEESHAVFMYHAALITASCPVCFYPVSIIRARRAAGARESEIDILSPDGPACCPRCKSTLTRNTGTRAGMPFRWLVDEQP